MSVTRHNFRLFKYWAFFVEIQENLPRSNANYTKFAWSTLDCAIACRVFLAMVIFAVFALQIQTTA